MNPLPIIGGLLQAATAACKAFPIALAWKINSEIESNNENIIELSKMGTAESLRHADELRLKNAYRKRLHDALLPANPENPKGDSLTDIGRAIPVPD